VEARNAITCALTSFFLTSIAIRHAARETTRLGGSDSSTIPATHLLSHLRHRLSLINDKYRSLLVTSGHYATVKRTDDVYSTSRRRLQQVFFAAMLRCCLFAHCVSGRGKQEKGYYITVNYVSTNLELC
jgi:hypothetical protein